MNVLHVVADSFTYKEHFTHGSTKDVNCRKEYFRTRGINVVQLPVLKIDVEILGSLKRKQLDDFDAILIDIPRSFPKTFKFLRRQSLKAILIYRSHNAEFFHRIDWMLASNSFKLKLEYLRVALKGLYGDILTLYYSDYVLPIAEWDAKHYWKRLGNSRKVKTIPYFISSDYLQSESNTANIRTNICVCVTAVLLNPLIIDAARNFCDLVASLEDQLPDWRFVMTGNIDKLDFIPDRVEKVGMLDSLQKLLSTAKVITILSDYGRGFKTKALEAINEGAYVMVTPGLYKRFPEEVKPYCLSIRKNSIDDFVHTLQSVESGENTNQLNSTLRGAAFKNLDSIFSRQDP